MKALICGCRDWDDYDTVYQVIKGLSENYPDLTIIEGECSGADQCARNAAIELGIPVRGYPAQWKKYGAAAGPIRNQQMIDQEHPDICIGFHPFLPNSRGTKDMLRKASDARIPIYIIKNKGDL